jgi:hypothetical protein
MVSPDGKVCGCMRNDHRAVTTVLTRAGAMHIHKLDGFIPLSSLDIPLFKGGWKTPPAPADHLHAVYTAMLEALTLSEFHAVELAIRRALSEGTVARNLYRTVPTYPELDAVVANLASRFDLLAVPGFWVEHRIWQCVATPGELLIPAFDEQGRITALLRGARHGQPKYRWMSNGQRGASCGSPLTFAQPQLADLHPNKPVVVTEGILKAHCIAEQLQLPVVGCGGTSVPRDIAERLSRRFPQASCVWVAFDADEGEKPQVRQAVVTLLQQFAKHRIRAERLVWDPKHGKGLDDVLMGGAK